MTIDKRIHIAGPVGRIEALCDSPLGPLSGIAIIGHPNPTLGGTPEHKIPHFFARVLQSHGYLAVRPYFRGVGATEGAHDLGDGESEDMLAVVRHLQGAYPTLPLTLVGSSFGAYVQAIVARRMLDEGMSLANAIFAGMPFGSVDGQRFYDTPVAPTSATVIHSENDSSVPLKTVLDWARPQALPVVVIPGANHFFAGKLTVLQAVVAQYL